jgi:signal transduction histidine kinase
MVLSNARCTPAGAIGTERVLERERARIAQDLHDDLGSSLTRISLLSGLAREDKDNASQVEAHVNKISQSAAQTLRALGGDCLGHPAGQRFAAEPGGIHRPFCQRIFEGGVRCRLDLPADLPARPLPPEMRHNIFLVVKEALTNALKHAGAREVRVRAEVDGRCAGNHRAGRWPGI